MGEGIDAHPGKTGLLKRTHLGQVRLAAHETAQVILVDLAALEFAGPTLQISLAALEVVLRVGGSLLRGLRQRRDGGEASTRPTSSLYPPSGGNQLKGRKLSPKGCRW